AGEDLSAADVGDEGGVRDEEDVSDEEDLRDGEDVRAEEDVGVEEEVYDEEICTEEDDEEVDEEVASSAVFGDGERLERVLLRFVFKGEGRSLSKAKDSIELLHATQQWIDDGKGQASIIDLGLSHLKDSSKILDTYPANDRDQEIENLLADCRPHHHVTGTLPFVAIDLLNSAEKRKECTHQLHHDLESVFWVLLYTCIKHHEGQDTVHAMVFSGLTSPHPHTVLNEKTTWFSLNRDESPIGGKFDDLRSFLRQFGKLCHRPEGVVQASEVKALVLKELQRIQKKKKKWMLEEKRMLKEKRMPEEKRVPKGQKRGSENSVDHGRVKKKAAPSR
ncbi:hypothetical protein FRC01_010971, partial [Tulasnella sp. 417]